MTTKAEKFVQSWLAENVQATGYEEEGDEKAAKDAAFAMLAAADKTGISRADIEAYTGAQIVEFMAAHIEAVNDAEVERLAAKEN